MKRSRTTRLLLMGMAPLALTACEGEQQAQLYETEQACIAAGQIEAQQCKDAYAAARSKNDEVAPRYASRADCVADYGEQMCSGTPGHHGFFVPFMTGMLIGRALDGGGYYPQPAYRNRTGDWNTAGGYGLGRSTGNVSVKKSAAIPPTRAITVSRSGFGSRAAARGGWGG